MPEDLRDWVPTGTLISWLEEQVEELGLGHGSLLQDSTAQGTPSAKALLRILAFACVTSVFDDQEIVRLCYSDVAYRLLSDGTPLWPSDLARFRHKRREMLVQTLEQISLRALQDRDDSDEIVFGDALHQQLHDRAIDLVNASCRVSSCDD